MEPLKEIISEERAGIIKRHPLEVLVLVSLFFSVILGIWTYKTNEKIDALQVEQKGYLKEDRKTMIEVLVNSNILMDKVNKTLESLNNNQNTN